LGEVLLVKEVNTIFFDLGYTLINFKGNVDRVLAKSHLALADSLKKSGVEIDKRNFARQYHQIISRYYATRESDNVEQPIDIFVNRTLASFGIPPARLEIVKQAISAMFQITEAHWHLESDTHPTLRQLKEMGFRLCIISNASNTDDLNALVDKARLRPYFEAIVISADVQIRKPDTRIFLKALEVMDALPETSLMVGDTLSADVRGAQEAGISAVWITRRARRPENNRVKKEIKPDYIITRLSQLPELMKSL
jgi:HAD superfamily hydrolase (TIGR01662 family)